METQAPENNQSRDWYFRVDCGLCKEYGFEVGILIAYHISKYRYFATQGKLTEGGGYYCPQSVIMADLNWPKIKVRRTTRTIEGKGILVVDKESGQKHYYGINLEMLPTKYHYLLNGHIENYDQGDHSTMIRASTVLPETVLKASTSFKRKGFKVSSKEKKQGDFLFSDSLGEQGNIQTPAPSPETVAFKLMLRAQREMNLFEGMDAAQVQKTLLEICAPKLVERYKTEKTNLPFDRWVKFVLEAAVEYNIEKGRGKENIEPHFLISKVIFGHAVPWYKQWLKDNVGGIRPTWSFWRSL